MWTSAQSGVKVDARTSPRHTTSLVALARATGGTRRGVDSVDMRFEVAVIPVSDAAGTGLPT